MTEVELNKLIELLSHQKGGGSHGEMVKAFRFAEAQGWKFTAPVGPAEPVTKR
jgi:hypothetical protein